MFIYLLPNVYSLNSIPQVDVKHKYDYWCSALLTSKDEHITIWSNAKKCHDNQCTIKSNKGIAVFQYPFSAEGCPHNKWKTMVPVMAYGRPLDTGGKCPKNLYASRQEVSDSDTYKKPKDDDRSSHSDSFTDS